MVVGRGLAGTDGDLGEWPTSWAIFVPAASIKLRLGPGVSKCCPAWGLSGRFITGEWKGFLRVALAASTRWRLVPRASMFECS